MKRFALFILTVGIAAGLFAQEDSFPPYSFVSGAWGFAGKRVIQRDGSSKLAKVNLEVPQSGAMIYEFNAKYEGGAEDGQGGFGIHIFQDKPCWSPSWGNGKSYLLWLNYDTKPGSGRIPAGLSAQLYRSSSNSRMKLVESVSMNQFMKYLTPEVLAHPISFKILVNGQTGEIRVYDPTDPNGLRYYYCYMEKKDLPMKGNWMALRTNGMKLSFGLDD
jgi:hypothetical protein